MNSNLVNEITSSISTNKVSTYKRVYKDILYTLYVFKETLPFIVVVPHNISMDTDVILSACSLENGNIFDKVKRSLNQVDDILDITYDNPAIICIPILPLTVRDKYYQQLSKEVICDDVRVDDEIVHVVKEVFEKFLPYSTYHKVIMMGYSSTGVFAERFTFLHPELVKIAIIGGAIGSIPVLNDNLSYPLGLKDYEKICKYKFNYEEYKKIVFRYFVAENEALERREGVIDEQGHFAPLHDMSYFERSINSDEGQKYRDLYGVYMDQRFTNVMHDYQDLGIDIMKYELVNTLHADAYIKMLPILKKWYKNYKKIDNMKL